MRTRGAPANFERQHDACVHIRGVGTVLILV